MKSSENPKTARLAVPALIALALIWSYNWIVAKAALRYIAPLDFAALRCAIGALLLLLLLPLTGRSPKPPPGRAVLLIGLFQAAGMIGLSQLALQTGGAGKTAVLAYTMPFWVILFTALFFNERPRPSQYAAALLAAAGLLLVLQPWQWQGTWLSSLLAVASGASWAAGSVIAKHAFRRQAVDLFALAAWQTAVGAVALALPAVITHDTPIVWSPYLLLALGFSAALSTALCWLLWLFVLRALPAAAAGLSMLMVPVMSVLWAWWLLGETPDGAEGGGIALILLALLLVGLADNWKPMLRRVFAAR